MKISIIELVKKIPRFSGYLLQMIFYYIVSIFYKDREKYKDAWLICERGTEARDNGYWMFKYIREKHPEQKIYYIIDSKNQMDFFGYPRKIHFLVIFFFLLVFLFLEHLVHLLLYIN